MSNLNTINNQFEFNLPIDFVPEHIEERYKSYLKDKKKLYKSILDYLNSNIISVTFPSTNFPLVSNSQIVKRKQIQYKSVTNIYDTLDKTVTITFKNVDSNLNYLIMYDVLSTHYLNVEKLYDQNIQITVVDENRSAIYHIKYKDIMWTTLSDNVFAYNDAILQSNEFTASFTFNFFDFEYVPKDIDIIKGR